MQVSFKPLQERNIAYLNRVRNSVRDFLHDNRKFKIKETREWFKTLSPDQVYYIVSVRDLQTTKEQVKKNCLDCGEGDPCWGDHYPFEHSGRVGYFRTKRFNDEIIDVGMDLDPQYQGFGIAKPAYKALLDQLFKVEGYKIAMLEVLANNTRAYNLYRDLGFEVITSTIFQDVVRDGRKIASLPMGLLASTWLKEDGE